MPNLTDLLQPALNTPPKKFFRWVSSRLRSHRTERQLPRWERWLSGDSMGGALGHKDFSALLASVRHANPFPGLANPAAIRAHITDDVHAALREQARRALKTEVNLLGSGWIRLSEPIDWTLDFKSAQRWPMSSSRSLPVDDLDNPSDILVPWRLSRLQWALPAAQVYVLDGDEAHAEFCRDIVGDWISGNPICIGPNWIRASEAAYRAIAMLWMFHACKGSEAWQDRRFLERLFKSLVLHGRFIELNLEFDDVDDHRLTAGLAGLSMIGISIGGKGISSRWIERSWKLLRPALFAQTAADGAGIEGSLAYHRLAAELFALPAMARRHVGLHVDTDYLDRLTAMADVTDAATRPDGTMPLWGDGDDGRALPLGTQPINDHRYLSECLYRVAGAPGAARHDETLWWFGPGKGKSAPRPAPASAAFKQSGLYVMRGGGDYVFVGAGSAPLGIHGHNDCLGFEAALDGVSLIVDPGSYVFTADWQARNRDRSTAAHNTPMLGGHEINRLISPKTLFRVHADARPEVRTWQTSGDLDLLVAAHDGYRRLNPPVTVVRKVMLEKSTHRLMLADTFEGNATQDAQLTLTFAPGAVVAPVKPGVWRIKAGGKAFLLIAPVDGGWHADAVGARYAPSYGIQKQVAALNLKCPGPLSPLVMALIPETGAPADPLAWLSALKLAG